MPHRRHDVATRRAHRRQAPHVVNRAIRHLNLAVALAGLAACATVRVIPEAHAETPETSDALQPLESVVVQSGDTLLGIAARHGATLSQLARWNGLSEPYILHPGQRLRLTAPTAIARAECGRTPSPADTAAPAVYGVPTRKPRPGSTVTKAGEATAASSAKKKTVRAAASAEPDTAAWRWPADGVVLARESNVDGVAPGIDIVGAAGSSVRAAADGVVIYSGAGSPGYEELVVLRHADGWVSSYAHNRKRLVGEGQYLQAGTPVAEMGRTGTSRDMLHFELRHDGALVDPLQQLPPR